VWLAVSWTSAASAPLRLRVLLSLPVDSYSWITSTKSPSFCMTNFSASLTNFAVLLPQSHDCSCYVSRPILTPPPLWLQKRTDLRAHGFAHSPDLWHQPRLATVTCAWTRRLYGISTAVRCSPYPCHEGIQKAGVQIHLSSALDGREWTTTCPSHFRERTPLPIVHWVGSRDSLTVLGSRKIYIPLRRIEPQTVQPV